MPARPATLSTARLLRRRTRARLGLLGAAAAATAIAVATTALVGLTLISASPGPPPVGMDEETFAAEAAAGRAALAQTAPALVLVVVLLGAAAVVQLARLLATARAAESTFARARGLSPRQAWAIAAPEAAAVAAVGAVAGIALAVVVAPVLPAGAGLASPAAPAILAASAVLALLLGAAQLFVATRRPAADIATGRVARAAGVVLVVVLLLAAGFVIWRLRTAPPAPGMVDPVAAAAPPVLLLAAAVVVLALFAPVTRTTAAVLSRGAGLGAVLPARQASRRLAVHGVAVLLVAFAAAQVVFAAASAATWQRLVDDAAAVSAGADLRVDLGTDAASPALVADAAAVPGIRQAAPVLATRAETGQTAFDLVAVPGSALPEILAPAGNAVDTAGLADAVAFSSGAAEIPAAATVLRVRADVISPLPQAAGLVEISAVVVDAAGAYGRIRVDVRPGAPAGDTTTLEGEGRLPVGEAPWRLVAVTAQLRAALFTPTAEVLLREVAADPGGPIAAVSGTATLDPDRPDAQVWLADPGTDDAGVPAVISTAFAARLGLAVGDRIDFRYDGSGRSGSLLIADVVPAIPGASAPLAAFSSLDALTAAMLRGGTTVQSPTSLWASGDATAAAALSAATDDRLVRTAQPGPGAAVAGALRPAWAVVAAGGVALALVAVIAIVQALAVARSGEVAALRAVGVRPGGQARMRAAELAEVIAVALVGGAATGLAAAALAVPALALAAAPGAAALPPEGIAVAWPATATGLGGLVVGLAVIVVVAAARVRRAARVALTVEAGR